MSQFRNRFLCYDEQELCWVHPEADSILGINPSSPYQLSKTTNNALMDEGSEGVRSGVVQILCDIPFSGTYQGGATIALNYK